MNWDRWLRLEPYQGVLFVNREAIEALTGSHEGAMLEADLEGETIRITWEGSQESWLSWPALQERANLAHLGSPLLAFVSVADVLGLLFTSSTPHEGLPFVEPHSSIGPIGWLTAAGFEGRP